MVDEARRVRYPARLLSSTVLSPRATLIRVLVDEKYEYRAGQYVAVSLGDGANDSYYSFASAPDAARPSEFELCLATVGKPELERLSAGDRITVSAPLGGVPFLDEDFSLLWLFGIGTGVAPLRAIVQGLQESLPGVSLVVGHRDVRGSLFHHEFEGLSRKGLDYRPFVSQELGDGPFGRGRIQNEVARLVDATNARIREVHAVVCGRQDMAQSVFSLLVRAGVPQQQIHQEGY